MFTGTYRASTVSTEYHRALLMQMDAIPSLGMSSDFSLRSGTHIENRPMGSFTQRGSPDIHPSGHIEARTHPCPCRVISAYRTGARVLYRTSGPWEGAQCRHTRATRHCPRDPIPDGRRPRHSSCNARPHHDTRMCHGVARLGHRAQGWWRADTMPPPIVHFEAYLVCLPGTSHVARSHSPAWSARLNSD